MSKKTLPDPGGARVPTRPAVWVALGFKQAEVKWEWVEMGGPWMDKRIATYVREKRWTVADAATKWAGLGMTLLGYERPEPESRGLLWRYYLDIDAEGDLERARGEAVKAHDGLVALGVTPLVRFSGSKGFGLEVAGRDFHRGGFLVDAHHVGLALHDLIVEELGLDVAVVDRTLWARRKLIVCLGVPHPKTGLYAIPLTGDELRGLSIADIKALAGARREVARPKASWSDGLNALFERARVVADTVSSSAASKAYTPRTPTAPKLLPVADVPDDLADVRALLRNGLTPCVRDLALGAPRDVGTRRNSLTTALARWARGMDLSEREAKPLIRRLLATRTTFKTPVPDAMSAADHAVAWTWRRPPDFSPTTCSTIRSFGLVCTDACPFHADYTLATGPAGRRQLPVRDETFVPPDPPTYTTIAEARADIARTVREIVEGSGAWLLTIPPGAGKSRTTLSTLVDWSATEGGGRILYLAPRHELIEQANVWTGNAFVHVRPRGEDTCERHARAAEVARRGFRADRWVCAACPRYPTRDCGYWRQWRDRRVHWAMTLEMAAGLDIAEMGFAVVVIDESVVPHAHRLVEVDGHTLAETVGRAFPRTTVFPEDPGFHEFGFEYTDADRAWRALVNALRGWIPDVEVKERAATAAVHIGERMNAHGVTDPEAGLRALIEAGFTYAEEGEFDPEIHAPPSTNAAVLLPPTDWIETVLRVLVEGLEQRRKDPTRSGAVPLRIEADPVGGWLLVAGRSRPFRLGDGPIVHLDGTGDAGLDARVLGRPVEELRFRMTLGRDQVVQLNDAKYARSTLFTANGKVNPRTFSRILAFLEARCPEARTEDARPGKTLVVTYKALALAMLAKGIHARLGGPDRVSITWFGGNRGKDYADHDQCVVIGYPYPDEDSVIDAASVLFEGENLDTSVTEVWRPYLHGDGKTGLMVRVFADPRLNAVCEQVREAEFYQSLMRIRPLGNPWKRIVLLTQVPALLEQDVVLSGLYESALLYGEASRARSVREAVAGHARRMIRKLGWTGCRWIADLCAGEVSPTAAIGDTNRGAGGNPTVAILPSWASVIETVARHRLTIPFDVEGGKRLHRLRDHFEAILPDGMEAMALTVSPEPPPSTGGRPWSDVVYCDGMRGRKDVLERIRVLVATGEWRVDIDGARVDVARLDALLGGEGTAEAATDSVSRWAYGDEDDPFRDPEYRAWFERVTEEE